MFNNLWKSEEVFANSAISRENNLI